MDDYNAHWTSAVKEKADELGLQLILVPKGTTAEAQPLDVSFNGDFKRKRQVEWVAQRFESYDTSDSFSLAVKRASKAYDSVSEKVIIDGWRPALGE
jgi:hypothetical protein